MCFAKALHLIGVAYFLGFLLLDAIVLRHFLNSECHDKKILFYEKAKSSLYFSILLIVFSGVYMLIVGKFWSVPVISVKIAFAATAIAMFFVSVRVVKILPKGGVHYYYGAVTFFAIIALVLGASVR